MQYTIQFHARFQSEIYICELIVKRCYLDDCDDNGS